MPRLHRILLKTVRISAWPLLALMILYFVSGYALCGLYGLGGLLSVDEALAMHRRLDLPLLAVLPVHVAPAVWLALVRRGWIGRSNQTQGRS
jgi:UPF0716 family protein affecting phage T7 exclusion